MGRGHDGLGGDCEGVGVPGAAEDPAGGVVEDEVVADVDPEARVHVREEGEDHGEGGPCTKKATFLDYRLNLFGLKFNCVTNLKDLPDMRSEKVMVRLAPWKRSMECMREGRWNRVLDLECKSDQSEFHLKFVQFEIIFGQRQFSLRFDQLE